MNGTKVCKKEKKEGCEKIQDNLQMKLGIKQI